ncbi:DP-EP family protein [Agaribacter marinus]|uniref:DP-EP family protein n=1 Tax=Agaribacter marinus TaxID=1431249 RepID=A0AA37SXK5_9ALTE|nr:DP-EP family protein [Agaribacter marinus]GLR69536.1 hypothetical protein GCM10007852_04440 [Agaribacter marinus]
MSKILFNTTIETSITPPIFTFYNEDSIATNGSVEVECGKKAQIIYTLDTPGYFFTQPVITNNFNNDICYTIENKGETLVITFHPETDHEDIGLQLVVQNTSTGQKYASPDPRIRANPNG